MTIVKQKRLLALILSSFVLLFAACSKNDENNDNEVEPNNEPVIENEENEEENGDNEEENEENEEVGQSSSDGEIDFTSLLEYVEENTEGETKVVHESHEQQVHEEERSEEHTSELQSRGHLVCRRLLEKKKPKHSPKKK